MTSDSIIYKSHNNSLKLTNVTIDINPSHMDFSIHGYSYSIHNIIKKMSY